MALCINGNHYSDRRFRAGSYSDLRLFTGLAMAALMD